MKNHKIKDGDYVSYIESLHKNKHINNYNDDIFNKNQNKNNIQDKNINILDKDVSLDNKDSKKINLSTNKRRSSFFMFLLLFALMLISYLTDNPKYIAVAMCATILKIVIQNIIEKKQKNK